MACLDEQTDGLQRLVRALNTKLGPCSGIDSDDVDPKELQQLMRDYDSDETEWSKYFYPVANMAYTRNLVDKGNGKSNLCFCQPCFNATFRGSDLLGDEAIAVADLMIDASTAQETCRHANAHCIMKVLKGSLVETRYAWPTIELNNSTDRPMRKTIENTYHENEVTYMSDKLGLHSIKNPSSHESAVSLHLYTPPNAAVYGCNVFNEETGHVSHIKKTSIFSAYGSPISQIRL